MNRTLTKSLAGEDLTRFLLRYETDECLAGTDVALYLKFEMLKMLSFDPLNSQCGYKGFEKLRMWHDGSKWIVEMEAVCKNP